jgi:hypothetical protein
MFCHQTFAPLHSSVVNTSRQRIEACSVEAVWTPAHVARYTSSTRGYVVT